MAHYICVMPDIYYQDGANLRHISDVYYQDGASLRTLTEVWYQDGASLRKVWSKSVALVHLENLTQTGRALTPKTASASIMLNTLGVVQGRANTNVYTDKFTWLLSGASSDYQVRASVISGTAPTGSATNTWLTMSSPRDWTISNNTEDTSTTMLLIELRDVATSTIRATATFTLQATQDASP